MGYEYSIILSFAAIFSSLSIRELCLLDFKQNGKQNHMNTATVSDAYYETSTHISFIETKYSLLPNYLHSIRINHVKKKKHEKVFFFFFISLQHATV